MYEPGSGRALVVSSTWHTGRMEPEFWRERWEAGQSAWDQPAPHPALEARWGDVGVAPGAAVFVPLCGTSVDMVWLAEQGHRVVGSELSELAVRRFFERVDLVPDERRTGGFGVFSAGPFELWCGDHFALAGDTVADVAAVYDRASLVALPPDARRRYAEHLVEVLPAGASSFLLTYVYDADEMDGPPFSVPGAEVDSLFGQNFDVVRLDATDVTDRNPELVARGLSAIGEELHLLRPRS